jgi:hypothetical protein
VAIPELLLRPGLIDPRWVHNISCKSTWHVR